MKGERKWEGEGKRKEEAVAAAEDEDPQEVAVEPGITTGSDSRPRITNKHGSGGQGAGSESADW